MIDSKIDLLESPKLYEFAIIGSSTTQNNINTQILRNKGIDILNIGIPGISWEDYMTSFYRLANDTNIKVMILSISPKLLINEPKCPTITNYIELYMTLKLRGPNCLMNISKSIIFPLLKYIPFLSMKFNTKFSHEDERGINNIRGDENRHVVTYKNGDGEVFSKLQTTQNLKFSRKTIGVFNKYSINYINSIFQYLTINNKKLILNIERGPYPEISPVDIPSLRTQLNPGIKIFNHSNTNPDETYWADLNHYNTEGIIWYTSRIADLFSTTKK